MNFPTFSCARVVGLLLTIHVEFAKNAVSEEDLLPFGESIGDSRFYFGDDNAKAVEFTLSPFKIFNQTYWSTHISGNGLISFREGFSNSRPGCNEEDLVSTFPIIMAFWADAHETSESRLTYRETTSGASLTEITHLIRHTFPQHRTINLSWLFVVTWKRLTSHAAVSNSQLLSQRNTFQLILATNGVSSFVVLYYNRIMWPSNAACAGFHLASGTKQFKIPGCCSSMVKNITETSNINVPGKWGFQVDSSLVLPSSSVSTCEKSKPTLRLEPQVLPITGNVPLLIHGLCLKEGATVACTFQDKGLQRPGQVKAILLQNVTICPVPFLYTLGRMTVSILVSYQDQSPVVHSEKILIVKEHEFSDLPSIQLNRTETSYLLYAQWDPALLSLASIKKEIPSNNTSNQAVKNNYCQLLSELVQIVLLEYDGKIWRNLGSITPPLLNNGVHMSPLNISLVSSLLQRKRKILLRTLAIQTNYTLESGESIHKTIPANSLLVSDNLIGMTFKVGNEANKTDYFSKICQNWIDGEANTYWDTLSCPNTLEQAHLDWRFTLDGTAHSSFGNELASAVYVQSVPSTSGAASQCIYDNEGKLNQWVPGGGRIFRRSPNSVTGYWKHYLDDRIPHLYCCKWNPTSLNDCLQFYRKRTVDFVADYLFPQPFRLVGGSHATTFDGYSYTFNSSGGEYWMIRYTDSENDNHIFNQFNAQVKLEIFVPENKKKSNASVVTAVVMEESTNEHDVKVQVSIDGTPTFKNGLSILVDGEFVRGDSDKENINDDEDTNNDSLWNFPNDFTLYYTGVIIVIKSLVELIVTFKSGVSFNFIAVVNEDENKVVALNIVGSAEATLKLKVGGLLGNFDGDVSNDIKLSNVTITNANTTVDSNVEKNWLVKKGESLFSTFPGKPYREHHSTSIPLLVTTDQGDDLNTTKVNVCDDFEDCISDYLNTGSKAIAEGTKGSSVLFQELDHISKIVVRHCTHNITKPINGRLIGTSFVEGSSIKVDCNTIVTQEEKYKCISKKEDNSTYSAPVWLNSNEIPYSSTSFTCELMKDTEVAESTTKKINLEEKLIKTLVSTTHSLTSHVWIIVLVILIAIVIIIIIMCCPPCVPVKRFFRSRYYRYQISIQTGDDSIALN